MHRKTRRRHRKYTMRSGVLARPGWLIVMLLMVGLFIASYTARKRYMDGTTIGGVDCSRLTVSEAKERIETSEVTIKFSGKEEYHVPGTEIGRYLVDTSELQEILEMEHRNSSIKNFGLGLQAFSVDEDKVSKYLKSLEELNPSNMRKPKNAYLDLNAQNKVEIVKEELGSKINFNEACGFAVHTLENGSNFIDFTGITDIEPEIKSTNPELVSKMQEMNKILTAEIKLQLRDGSIYPTLLNNEITRTWVRKDAKWGLDIELDENLASYVSGLNEAVQELGQTIEFETVDHEIITISVPKENRDSVDEEAEIAALKSELKNGKNTTREPNYSRLNRQREWSQYIEVPKKYMHTYVHENGEIIRDMPCQMGIEGTSRESHEGLFYLISKSRDKNFDLGGHSDYWMKYNKYGEGFHDANWQPEWVLGNPEANGKYGSHGCDNLRGSVHKVNDAEWLYGYITYYMPIIVY